MPLYPPQNLSSAEIQPGNMLTSGVETIPRNSININTLALVASQSLRLTYFTARKSFTSAQVRVPTGNIAAGATPTLIRLGLYSIAADGSATLVASTANDTTLFALQATAYTRSWSTPVSVVQNQRYALGILVVTSATIPNFLGYNGQSASEMNVAPRLCGALGSQADLPASYADASLTTTAQMFYGVVLP